MSSRSGVKTIKDRHQITKLENIGALPGAVSATPLNEQACGLLVITK